METSYWERIKQKFIWTPNFISRFLAKYLTILHDTKFIRLRILRPTLSMAWIWEIERSISYQQMRFDGFLASNGWNRWTWSFLQLNDKRNLAHGCLLLLEIQSAMDGIWKEQSNKSSSSWRMTVEMNLKWCLDDAVTKVWSCSLEDFEEFWKWPRNEIWENEWILSLEAARSSPNAQKNDYILLFRLC